MESWIPHFQHMLSSECWTSQKMRVLSNIYIEILPKITTVSFFIDKSDSNFPFHNGLDNLLLQFFQKISLIPGRCNAFHSLVFFVKVAMFIFGSINIESSCMPLAKKRQAHSDVIYEPLLYRNRTNASQCCQGNTYRILHIIKWGMNLWCAKSKRISKHCFYFNKIYSCGFLTCFLNLGRMGMRNWGFPHRK